MKPGPGEPAVGTWRVQRFDVFARSLIEAAGAPSSRPCVVAVDGRGGGGKSTLAERLHRALPGSAVVHTDDVAWWHSRFGWADLLVDGILVPLHQGGGVHFQPPAWAPRGRTDHIDVPAGASVVIVEGVGAARREVAHLVDVVIWVQSDFAEAERRGVLRDVLRDGDELAVAIRQWHEWADEEVPFLLADRPWERANVVVAGTEALPHDPEAEIVVALPDGGAPAHPLGAG